MSAGAELAEKFRGPDPLATTTVTWEIFTNPTTKFWGNGYSSRPQWLWFHASVVMTHTWYALDPETKKLLPTARQLKLWQLLYEPCKQVRSAWAAFSARATFYSATCIGL